MTDGANTPGNTRTGRPSKYSQEIVEDICFRLANGEPLTRICRDDWMPHYSTVMRWLGSGDHPDFCDMYARAREVQADYLADQIVEIADDTRRLMVAQLMPDPNDPRGVLQVVRDEAGNPAVIADARALCQAAKEQIDARKWIAAKLKPRKYSEKHFAEVETSAKVALSDDERAKLVEILKNPDAAAAAEALSRALDKGAAQAVQAALPEGKKDGSG